MHDDTLPSLFPSCCFASFPHKTSNGRPPLRGKGKPSSPSLSSFSKLHKLGLIIKELHTCMKHQQIDIFGLRHGRGGTGREATQEIEGRRSRREGPPQGERKPAGAYGSSSSQWWTSMPFLPPPTARSRSTSPAPAGDPRPADAAPPSSLPLALFLLSFHLSLPIIFSLSCRSDQAPPPLPLACSCRRRRGSSPPCPQASDPWEPVLGGLDTDPWGRPLPAVSCRHRRSSPPCSHALDPVIWMRCGRMEEEGESVEAAGRSEGGGA